MSSLHDRDCDGHPDCRCGGHDPETCTDAGCCDPDCYDPDLTDPYDRADCGRPAGCGRACGGAAGRPDEMCEYCRADYDAWCDTLAAIGEALDRTERGVSL